MALSSLNAGISGLKASQTSLNVIGDNLANLNTSGFKASRVSFADELSNTLKQAQAPAGVLGGINPMQVGTGVKVGSINRDFSQGSISPTGRPLDLAIQGKGFFILDGTFQDFYTRVGSFGLDINNDLVDTASGLKVKSVGGLSITMPVNSVIPAKPTSAIALDGNLDANTAIGAVKQIVTASTAYTNLYNNEVSNSGYTTATGVAKATTALNDLTQNTTDYVAGDVIDITGTDTAAAAVATTFTFGTANDGTTVADLLAKITAAYTNSTASIGPSGEIILSTLNAGHANLDITLADNGGNTGASTFSAFTLGTNANSATLLNDLSVNATDYVANSNVTLTDTIQIVGTESDGTTVNTTFNYGSTHNGTTLGDLLATISNNYGSATATTNSSGNIVLTSDTPGTSKLTLSIADNPSITGATTYGGFSATTNGSGSTYVTTMQVFDTQGKSFPVTLTFDKTADNTWRVTPTLNPTDGSITTAITSITFNANGSLSLVGGVQTMTITNPAGSTQTVNLDIGSLTLFNGLTQFAGNSSAAATSQDGYESGFFLSSSVNTDGSITALFTNGQTQDVGKLQMAKFANPSGLSKEGGNMWGQTVASGTAILTTALSGGMGSIISGALEGSNVDIAEEFTNLIIAQRSFQANARTITTTDEIMQELVNIVR